MEQTLDPSSKRTSQFSSMEDITVDPKGLAKFLGGLNVHKAPGMPECWKSVAMRSLLLALVFIESVVRGDVPDDWQQGIGYPAFKKAKNMMLLIIDWCHPHASVLGVLGLPSLFK